MSWVGGPEGLEGFLNGFGGGFWGILKEWGVLGMVPDPQTPPGHDPVGVVSLAQLFEVAVAKQKDPGVAARGTPLPALVGSLVGSARSLGLHVVPRWETPQKLAQKMTLFPQRLPQKLTLSPKN